MCIQGRNIKKKKKRIKSDVRTHFKPTETFQYTHFSSCHPPGVRKGISIDKCISKRVMFYFVCVTFSVELHYVYRKYDMYVCVCNGNLNFEGFLLRLKNKLTILRIIAAKNNNLKKFMERWAPVL